MATIFSKYYILGFPFLNHQVFSDKLSDLNILKFSELLTLNLWDRGQISIKLGKKTCYIPKISKFFVEKRYLC